MKVNPKGAIRYTEIPKRKHPSGSTPAQITKYNMDSSYQLEVFLRQYQKLYGDQVSSSMSDKNQWVFSSNWNIFLSYFWWFFFQGPRNPCRIAIFVRLLFGWTTLRFFWAVEKATYHALHMWRCYFGTFSTLYEPHLWTVFSGNYLIFQFHQENKTVALTQCGN